MNNVIRPYLINPTLIEQPTWGGDYIVNYKGWNNRPGFANKKIGQSYELYGKSKLAIDISDTSDPRFGTDIDSPVTTNSSLNLEELIKKNPSNVLGPAIYQKYGKMPLLIKFTQALGNSFQLHAKSGVTNPRWKPKAESWYYFEDGYITLGIKKGIDLTSYKHTCIQINEKMEELSSTVRAGTMSPTDAATQAKEFIQKLNPWQFINLHQVKKYDLIDLSIGGLHHSWEENASIAPLGNVLYEVQQDVADEFATIRSFDQGKMKDNGEIRQIHIDDYFQFIDASEASNDIEHAKRKHKGSRLLATPFYTLDLLTITGTMTEKISDSFVHLFVRDGDVDVVTGNNILHLAKGHSCFVPWVVNSYEIRSGTPASVVLRTYI